MYGTPYYPTYQQNFQPYQQFQPYQHMQPRGLSGRAVSSADEIQVQEVPTDGTMA